jgi:hypothetical protein
MPEQSTNQLLMIRPAAFGYNDETAVNNAYQIEAKPEDIPGIRKKARSEFDGLVKVLEGVGIEVLVVEDTELPEKPDAVFPNNWISFHEENIVITYPMYAPKRRLERREDIVEAVGAHFEIERRYSFEHSEEDKLFLEGTGSMVLDRIHRVTYACLSPRTHIKILDRFCLLMDYEKIVFHAVDQTGQPIYHTNVMMAIGTEFAVVCLESIREENERKDVIRAIEKSGKELIDIDYTQLGAFAGNMLEVTNQTGQRYVVMSDAAHKSLHKDQLKRLSQHASILHAPIPIIEKYGGGSVRCMIAEVFLREK